MYVHSIQTYTQTSTRTCAHSCRPTQSQVSRHLSIHGKITYTRSQENLHACLGLLMCLCPGKAPQQKVKLHVGLLRRADAALSAHSSSRISRACESMTGTKTSEACFSNTKLHSDPVQSKATTLQRLKKEVKKESLLPGGDAACFAFRGSLSCFALPPDERRPSLTAADDHTPRLIASRLGAS